MAERDSSAAIQVGGGPYRIAGWHLEKARAELTTAVAMLREMGMTHWLPEAEKELAEVND